MPLAVCNSHAVCGVISIADTIRIMSSRKSLSPEQLEDARRLKGLYNEQVRNLNLGSQVEVAARLGYASQGTLSQYLNGKIPLNLEAVLKFSALLQVSPEQISPGLAKKLTGEFEVKPLTETVPAELQNVVKILLKKWAESSITKQRIRILESLISDFDVVPKNVSSEPSSDKKAIELARDFLADAVNTSKPSTKKHN